LLICFATQDVVDEEQHPEGFILEGQAPTAKPDEEQLAATDPGAQVSNRKRTRDEEAAVAAVASSSTAEQQQQQELQEDPAAAKRHKATAGHPVPAVAATAAADSAGAGTVNELVDLVSSDLGDGDDDDGDVIVL
jgi:hypothetical protein